MKKLLAILLVMISILSLSGCGGGVDKTKSKPEADENDTTVTVWSGDGGHQAIWEELVDEWNATTGDKKDIFINWETVMDSTQLDVAFQNDKLPQIMSANGTQRTKFRLAGKLVAINDLPGGEEFLKEYDQPGYEGANVFDGKQYFVWSTAQTGGLAYNKDLFVKAGIVDEKGEAKPPKTIAELREAAKKISEIDGVYGFALPLKLSLYYLVDIQSGKYFDLDSPAQTIDLDSLTVTYPGYKERYQWLLDMKEDGSLFPDALTLENDTARAYFSSGIIGMIPAISWDYGVYTSQFPAECDWAVCEFPAFEGRPVGRKTTTVGGQMQISTSALKDEKTAEATMEVYKFIYSLESRKVMYEKGGELSLKEDVLKEVDETKIAPQLTQFGELVEFGEYAVNTNEKYTTEGDSFDLLFQKVWMGEMSLDDAIKDYETRATAGLRKAVEKGEYNVERQKGIENEKREHFEEWKKNK